MLLVEAGKHIGDQIVSLVSRDAPPSLLEELKNRLLAHQNNGGNTTDSIHLQEETDNKPLYDPITPEKSIIESAPPVVVAEKKVEKVEKPVAIVKQKSPEPQPQQSKLELKPESEKQQQQQILVEQNQKALQDLKPESMVIFSPSTPD